MIRCPAWSIILPFLLGLRDKPVHQQGSPERSSGTGSAASKRWLPPCLSLIKAQRGLAAARLMAPVHQTRQSGLQKRQSTRAGLSEPISSPEHGPSSEHLLSNIITPRFFFIGWYWDVTAVQTMLVAPRTQTTLYQNASAAKVPAFRRKPQSRTGNADP